MNKRLRFYYIHRDGWVTDDIKKVQGKCVGVLEAYSKEEAERQARELGDID
jgi:hypothetical protein